MRPLESTPAGARDRRLVFFGESVTETGRGSKLQGKGAEIARAWGKVSYGTAVERRQAGIEKAAVAATARVPANAKTRLIDSSSTCELDGATWDVTGSVPFGRRELDITLVRKA